MRKLRIQTINIKKARFERAWYQTFELYAFRLLIRYLTISSWVPPRAYSHIGFRDMSQAYPTTTVLYNMPIWAIITLTNKTGYCQFFGLGAIRLEKHLCIVLQ